MSTQIAVCHLGKFYPPEYGGIESVTEALATDHAARGHDVNVICFSRGSSQAKTIDKVLVRRHRASYVAASQPLSWGYFVDGLRAVRRSDLVHVHVPNLLAALVVLLGVPRSVPVVVHWHADVSNKGFLGWLVRPLEKLLVRRATTIVCTSEQYRAASEILRGSARKTSIIPIGIADTGCPARSDITELRAMPMILFVGRLVPYKGLSVLIDAASKMNAKARFKIVGDGPLSADMQALVAEKGLGDCFDFEGKVSESRLNELYAAADVFCLPSVNRLEAFGVVLLEAMRAGLPTVAADIPGSGVPWVNSAGVTFKVGDAASLAEALDSTLGSSEKLSELSQVARQRFAQHFTSAEMSSKFLKLYDEVLQR